MSKSFRQMGPREGEGGEEAVFSCPEQQPTHTMGSGEGGAAAAGAGYSPPTLGDAPLPPFALERFFAQHEFSAPLLACCSDPTPLSMAALLALADEEGRALWAGLGLGYTDTAGLPQLRQEISSMYESIGPDDVTVLAPEEGVYLTMRALLSHGDTVVVTYPGYQSLYAVARSMGCDVKLWEPKPAGEEGEGGRGSERGTGGGGGGGGGVGGGGTGGSGGMDDGGGGTDAGGTGASGMDDGGGAGAGLRFDVADLVAMLEEGGGGPRVKAVIVNFPHNPTGFLPSAAEWGRLVDACRRHRCYLFSDEMYRGLELDPSARLPSAADAYERGVALCGVSKTHGLPGLRIGWLASRATLPGPAPTTAATSGNSSSSSSAITDSVTLQARVRELKDYTTICCSAPSEALALIGLRASRVIVGGHLATIAANADAFGAFVARFPRLLSWARPVAGSVAFPRLLAPVHVQAFCERCVVRCGVLLLPASVYDHALSVARGHFRVGLGRANLPECLDALGAWLASREEDLLAGKL
ncbi:hypothetical protein FOA52_005164 [Chlamydomonas sp. UWO 241]|nr:hypothetical protein FOA52_005164 [Chlamydomonas sp. UWO 241]